MSIQSNINQTLSLAGLLVSQSPMAKNAARGREIQSRGIAAQKGLENIYSNYKELEAGKRKPYSETEMSNIKKRIGQLNDTIYDAVISAEDPSVSRFIDKSAFGEREKRSSMLKELENFGELNSKMSKIKQMTQKAEDALKGKHTEQIPSKNFTKILNGEPIEDMFGADYSEPAFPDEVQRNSDEKIDEITEQNDPNYVHTLADKRAKAEKELQDIYDNYENFREDLENNYYAWHNGKEPSSLEAAEKASRKEASAVLGKLPMNADQYLGLSYEKDGNDEDMVKKIKDTEFDNLAAQELAEGHINNRLTKKGKPDDANPDIKNIVKKRGDK